MFLLLHEKNDFAEISKNILGQVRLTGNC